MPQPAKAPAPPQNSAECHSPLALPPFAVVVLAVVELKRCVLFLVLLENLLLLVRHCCFVALSSAVINLLPIGLEEDDAVDDEVDGEVKKRRVMHLVVEVEVEVEVEVTLRCATRRTLRRMMRELEANMFCCDWDPSLNWKKAKIKKGLGSGGIQCL